MSNVPPKAARRFLRWFCPAALFEGIEGDLLEEFEQDTARYGERRARRRFSLHVLRFFRAEILFRNHFTLTLINTIMLKSYFTLALRNMAKRRLYSFINAFGLSIGIAFCILIWLFIQDEKSFDRFNTDADRLYMITVRNYDREKAEKGDPDPFGVQAYLPARIGEAALEEVPEIEEMTRFQGGDEGVLHYREKMFSVQFALVDSGFFRMFTFPVYQGSTRHIFQKNSDIVLTRSIAEKFFGSEDPVGKSVTLNWSGEKNFTVAAVVEDPPANSSISFKVLVPMTASVYLEQARKNWGSYSYPTFVKVHPNTTEANLNRNLDAVVDKYMGEKLNSWREAHKIPKQYAVSDFNLLKFTDVHLDTGLGWQNSSDPKYSMILGGIALLILIIACINYVSLALTTSVSRRVEVGIRKVVGAQRNQLVYQFGFESLMLGMVSMIAGMGMVLVFLPSFNEFTGKAIHLQWSSVIPLMGFSLAVTLLVGLIAGSYPSVFISRFMPSQVLKGGFTSKLQAGFTKPLVVLQFALSAFLIISAVIMYRQMQYITTKDLGYNQDQVLVVNTQSGWTPAADKVVEQFRNKVAGNPDITGVAGTSISFNRGWSRYGWKEKDEHKSAYVYAVDYDYVPLLGIHLVAGRNFDPKIPSDSSGVIINESLAKHMGWKDPINEHLNWQEDKNGPGYKIVGVAKDYHFLSLEQQIEPMFLTLNGKNGHLTTMFVKLSAGDVPEKIEAARKNWSALNPDKPFDFTFLNDDVARQYEKYQRWMKIMGLSTVFAILIAALGLFGLAGINAVNRTKEVGIRKVMGASLWSIFVLMNVQYAWLAVIAFILATPASWYVMTHWYLAGFEFRITVGWELFALSMLAGLVIALITVSYHAIRVSLTNPAETLKYE